MNQHWIPSENRGLSRRSMLWQSSIGFGSLALHGLMHESTSGAESKQPAKGGSVAFDPAAALAERFGPIPARAKRVIFMFMHGGPSQVDTFDYKPQLEKDDNKPLPFDKPRVVSTKTGNLLKSPFSFQQYGESGIHVSSIFPHTARCVDDICFINSMWGSNSRHGAALLELHTGSDTFVRPSMGSWITYGLGSENQDLPGFITICPTLGHGGVNAWSSSFLPAAFQGTPVGFSSVPSEKAKIPFITNADTPPAIQRAELAALARLNRRHMSDTGPDSDLESRINSFELAFRMQTQVPRIQDISTETESTTKAYGLDDSRTRNFGRQCLMARRFAEQGVRFIQVTHSYKWDQHGNLKAGHAKNAAEVDQPIAALLTDLKQRGLLDDTLVVWGGEFGRTPTAQGRDGRDHSPQGYTMFLAGGGVTGGIRYGETDEYGYYAVNNKVHLHDLHATILHLMGLDHERLTWKYSGRDFRLTDVHGEVVHDIIA
jgi:hypothetical protein